MRLLKALVTYLLGRYGVTGTLYKEQSRVALTYLPRWSFPQSLSEHSTTRNSACPTNVLETRQQKLKGMETE